MSTPSETHLSLKALWSSSGIRMVSIFMSANIDRGCRAVKMYVHQLALCGRLSIHSLCQFVVNRSQTCVVLESGKHVSQNDLMKGKVMKKLYVLCLVTLVAV